MNQITVTLDNDDLNIIFESLCDNPDTDISDSALTDVFMALSKSCDSVTISTISTVNMVKEKTDDFDNEIAGIAKNVKELLNELDDLDDLSKPEKPTEPTEKTDDFNGLIVGMLENIGKVLSECPSCGNSDCTCGDEVNDSSTKYDDNMENWVVEHTDDDYNDDRDDYCTDCGEDNYACTCGDEPDTQDIWDLGEDDNECPEPDTQDTQDAWDSGGDCWSTK